MSGLIAGAGIGAGAGGLLRAVDSLVFELFKALLILDSVELLHHDELEIPLPSRTDR